MKRVYSLYDEYLTLATEDYILEPEVLKTDAISYCKFNSPNAMPATDLEING